MKTKVEAAKTLLNVGWTPAEVNLVLGHVLELNNTDKVPPETPWWSWVGEEWYTGGMPIDAQVEAWLTGQ